jgi:hypothetical protein
MNYTKNSVLSWFDLRDYIEMTNQQNMESPSLSRGGTGAWAGLIWLTVEKVGSYCECGTEL